MDETRRVFGIDLGTTYSCVAQVDNNDQAVVLRNLEGNATTPSVVFFSDDNTVIVGDPAKEESKINPDATVAFIKRQMSNDSAFDKPTNFPKGLTPSEISARILTKIVNDANEAGGYDEPIKRVVITCPAYFGDKERMRTKDAGKIAGLEVLSIINEPTAAAIAYAAKEKGLKGIQANEKKSVLVYDLGGGTFDITLIKIYGLDIQVIATGGNANLGGYDWDKKLAEYLLVQYNQKTGKSLEMKEGTALFNEMMMIAETQKKRLTARENTSAVITLNGEAESAKIELSREIFDKETEVLLDETIELTQKVITKGKEKGVATIDEILLVGGSSKMPQVKTRVYTEFQIEAKLADPDECVAKGAAILALNMSVAKAEDEFQLGDTDVKPRELGAGSKINIVNVTSQNYGIRVYNRQHDKVYVQNMIKANTPLDENCRSEKDDFCVPEGSENCGTIVFAIYESEHKTDRDLEKLIGLNDIIETDMGNVLEEHKMHIPVPVRENASVKVVFEIDAEGILHVHGEVEGVFDPIDFELKLKGVMSDEELKAAQALCQSEKNE